MLTRAKTSPDYVNYLTFLFASQNPPPGLHLSSEDLHTVRTSAAINLKNSVKTAYKTIPDTSQSYIRDTVLLGLEDPISQIRSFAGHVITEIVQQGGILGWPQLLPELLSLVGNDRGNVSPQAQEGAMSALAKVCEDSKKLLDRDYQGQRPLNVMIPKLLDFTTSPVAKVRALALASINTFIPLKPQALLVALDPFLARLFQLANDSSDDVRRNVCRSFVQLVDTRPDKIAPHMEGLVDYMVTQQRSTDDPELSLDAAEFWLCVGEHDKLRLTLTPYLGKIVPVLLESMVYSEEDVLRLERGGIDEDEEDRPEDLKPQFAKSKSARTNITSNGDDHQQLHTVVNGTNTSKKSDASQAYDDDELSEGEIDEYEDDEEGGDPEDGWNLRKCSAAALDVLASVFHRPVFEITLPYLKENIRHTEWPNREAAVLALGAVADGCLDAVTPHLPDLIPYLISLLDDSEPVVRQITCWSLGRYSAWASHLDDPHEKKGYFEPMIEGILNRMLDGNKRVQEAAASAFANLEEKATSRLIPYCDPIIRQFVRCFERYKDRNMFILYDCVQTLAEHIGPGLASQDLIDLLMPALIQRWNKVSDQSRELFPLLECLSYVATALGDNFAPFAVPIFTRCVRIIHQNLEEYLVAVNNQAMDKPDKDFLVTSLDLLSAIIQALDPRKSGELVSASQPRFFDLLTFCMEDPSNDVRQSSYALLGDCAIHIFPYLQPYLPSIMPVLIEQLDLDKILDEEIETGFSVVNNACWSCGEISMKEGAGMAPYVEKLYQRLMIIIGNPEVTESVNENAAIALGRLGVASSDLLAPHLAEFAGSFLQCTSSLESTDEKAHAFLGFNRIVARNPQVMEKFLVEYFKAIAAWGDDSSRGIEGSDVYDSFQVVSIRQDLITARTDRFSSGFVRLQDANPGLQRVLKSLKPTRPADAKAHVQFMIQRWL